MMAPRGDDFQLWFSPCSLAMCGGRALDKNTNQAKNAKWRCLLTWYFRTGCSLSTRTPVYHRWKNTILSPRHRLRTLNHPIIHPSMLCGHPSPWMHIGGSTNTNAKQGKQHDAVQLRSTSLVALHYTTTPEQEPGQLNNVLKCGFARVS